MPLGYRDTQNRLQQRLLHRRPIAAPDRPMLTSETSHVPRRLPQTTCYGINEGNMCTWCQDGRIEFPKAPFIRPDGVIPPPLVRCVPPNSYRKKILLERSRNKSWVELTPDRFSCTTASLGPPLGGKSAYRMSPKTGEPPPKREGNRRADNHGSVQRSRRAIRSD